MSRLTALHTVLASGSLALLLVACASETSPTSGAGASDDGEAIASTSSALSANDAVDRAEQWAAVKLHYCQAPNHGRDYDAACATYCSRTANKSWDPYRSDCSGLVSWAWGLPAPGRITTQFAPFQTDLTHVIPAAQLRAGDAINNSDHIMLFKEWIVPNQKALFVEEPGCSSAAPYARETTSAVSVSGNTIHVTENGMTFTAIRYGALTPPSATSGKLDGASCDGLKGYAEDTSAPAKSIDVLLSFDAAEGKAGAIPVHVMAATKRTDLCASIGAACDHGFTIPVPLGARDGKAHTIYAYGSDATGKASSLLALAPKTITCAAPAFPLDAKDAVKRSVGAASVVAAWKVDAYRDVAREEATAVDAYPKAADFPTAPLAVQADDGTPDVWVLDGSLKRHVVDAASLTAWGLVPTKEAASKIASMTAGPDWPKERFLFQAAGSADVYALDVALPAGAGPIGGGGAGEAAGGAGGSANGDPDPSAASGCAMGGATSERGSAGGAAWIGLCLAAVLVASRRHRGGRRPVG